MLTKTIGIGSMRKQKAHDVGPATKGALLVPVLFHLVLHILVSSILSPLLGSLLSVLPAEVLDLLRLGVTVDNTHTSYPTLTSQRFSDALGSLLDFLVFAAASFLLV